MNRKFKKIYNDVFSGTEQMMKRNNLTTYDIREIISVLEDIYKNKKGKTIDSIVAKYFEHSGATVKPSGIGWEIKF